MEQLQARVQPKQATFLPTTCNVWLLILKTAWTHQTPTQRFIFAMDQAYFKTMFFSGDRLADMGRVLVPEILRFPNNDGFLFNHMCGGKRFETVVQTCLASSAPLNLVSASAR